MKLDTNIITFIKRVIKTAQLVGVDNIIIETGKVRAVDDSRTIAIIQDSGVPTFPFESMALNRIDIFLSRLALVDNRDDFTIDAIIHEKTNQVSSLTMKGKGIKVDYRCANIDTMSKIPKQSADVLKYRVDIDADTVSLLQKAQSAMPQQDTVDVVTIVSKDDGVFFELSDVTGDVFSLKFAEGATSLIPDDKDTRFVYRYPIKTLLVLFKHNPTGVFNVGQRGILNVEVNNANIYVPPRA